MTSRFPQPKDGLSQRRRREKRILIQFSLISSVLLLFYASFWIIPELVPGKAGAVIVTLFGITSAGMNPFIYLVFNKLMMRKAKYLILEKLLGRKTQVQQIQHQSNTKVSA